MPPVWPMMLTCTCCASSHECAKTDLRHRILELLAVFGLVDRFGRGADQLDAVFAEHALRMQVERAVERGLATHGRQDRVRAFLRDDALDDFPGDRLDVGDVG